MALEENKEDIHQFLKEQAALRALEEAKTDPEFCAILVSGFTVAQTTKINQTFASEKPTRLFPGRPTSHSPRSRGI